MESNGTDCNEVETTDNREWAKSFLNLLSNKINNERHENAFQFKFFSLNVVIKEPNRFCSRLLFFISLEFTDLNCAIRNLDNELQQHIA